MYTSLCVTDPASPGLPLFVLSLMRGVSAQSAQSVCQTFAGLSLATLSFADNTEKRMVKLHHLQLEYCRAQCGRARATSHISVRSLVLEHTWHMRINDGLVAKMVLPAETNDSMDVGSRSASLVLQARAATSDAVVQALLDLGEDSALADYLLDNLVRHVCGYEGGGFFELYSAVVTRVRKWEESHKGLKWSDDATEFGRGFIGDLENIAQIIRVCVPSAAGDWNSNGEEAPYPVHGE
jgi:hypothetical protein